MNTQPEQTNETENPYRCDFNECGKRFKHPSGLTRHKKSHKITEAFNFKAPITPSNTAFMQVSGPEVNTLFESIRSTRISLDRMVFHQEDKSECQDYSDEKDEPFDEDIEFAESIVDEPEAVVNEIEDQTP
ncbi:hypothetical protein INT47_007287 [Mucor saturninus]|uniref:C2H2-type domain-containing protein n=1 Tax=Mucor saturninus TaxID=64648 RepID=A0A8H7V9L4_9FUNG|nr:hypothetical protein INT47_007287 [Mucor saturninus]